MMPLLQSDNNWTRRSRIKPTTIHEFIIVTEWVSSWSMCLRPFKYVHGLSVCYVTISSIVRVMRLTRRKYRISGGPFFTIQSVLSVIIAYGQKSSCLSQTTVELVTCGKRPSSCVKPPNDLLVVTCLQVDDVDVEPAFRPNLVYTL